MATAGKGPRQNPGGVLQAMRHVTLGHLGPSPDGQEHEAFTVISASLHR